MKTRVLQRLSLVTTVLVTTPAVVVAAIAGTGRSAVASTSKLIARMCLKRKVVIDMSAP